MQYVYDAEKYMNKSMCRDYKHGAVCVLGGRVVCGGWNKPSDPYMIKVSEKVHPV